MHNAYLTFDQTEYMNTLDESIRLAEPKDFVDANEECFKDAKSNKMRDDLPIDLFASPNVILLLDANFF